MASTIRGRRWSVELFERFWQKPDAARVMGALTEDIVGHWPRPIGLVQGSRDYINVIAKIIEVCPDFTVTPAEHAAAGEMHFVRWIARGTGPEGQFEFTGCDRVQTRNGHVCENYVFCDDPFFARVAAQIANASSGRGDSLISKP